MTELADEFDKAEATFRYQEPDPVKRAQMHEEMMNRTCVCGKTFREHSIEDHKACAAKKREEILQEKRDNAGS
jgi:hypothetical protein